MSLKHMGKQNGQQESGKTQAQKRTKPQIMIIKSTS
jgi:hypothetical protein